MPLTVLDPTPALIVVDLQKGVGGPRLPFYSTVVENSALLAARFRAHGLPVVLVNVAGGAPGRTDDKQRRDGTRSPRAEDWTELLDELGAAEGDIRITKRTWGAFHGTGLAEALGARGVTQVVVTGVATSVGVESTARAAHEHGLHVVLAVDAMTDPRAEAHRNSLARIFPRLGETASTADVLAMLEARAVRAGEA
ncbi:MULTISPECIES: isochorismatase family protein [Streptomyces]|jgi:nicotinamidase-related amidase|uniref:isochorismatase family protein n=1 Tax=Streptomyces TaxID=1883 RepID=UPI0033BBE6D3